MEKFSSLGYCKLVGTEVVDCDDVMEWAVALEPIVKIADTETPTIHISTIFIGIRTKLTGGPFETMVFGGPSDGLQARHETYQEALDFHNELKEMIHG